MVERLNPRFSALNLCWHCGLDLGDLRRKDAPSSTAAIFRSWLGDGRAGLGELSCPPMQALDALRGTCQLFLRRRSRDAILSAGSEETGIVGQLSVQAHCAQSVEHLGVQDRRVLVPAALKILREWPNSFVRFAEENNISRMHFFGVRQLQPNWMNECIDKHLARQNRTVTPAMIEQAIGQWTKENGTKPTKAAVRSLLKWQGDASLDTFYPKRKEASAEEWQDFIEAAGQMNQRTRARGYSHRAFQLDLCVLLASLVDGQSISEVIDLSQNEFVILVDRSRRRLSLDGDLSHLLSAALDDLQMLACKKAKHRQVRKRLVALMAFLPQELVRDVRVFRRISTSAIDWARAGPSRLCTEVKQGDVLWRPEEI